MVIYLFYTLLAINVFIYGLSFFFTLKFKEESVFSIRSPFLLLTNNLGGFLMSTCYILYNIVDSSISGNEGNEQVFCKLVPNNYILFHMLFFVSFALRCDRLIRTCKIKSGSIEDVKKFQSEHHKYLEVYYAKILIFVMLSFLLINTCMNFLLPKYLLTPYNFYTCHEISGADQSYLSIVWIILNFIENFVLIGFCGTIFYLNKLTFIVRLELILFTFVWIAFPNTLRWIEGSLTTEVDSTVLSCVSCIYLWICLLLNSYIPWIYSLIKVPEVTYLITPEHLDNFYIFLSHERSFKSFHEYLVQLPNESESKKGLFSLTLYTRLITFRLFFTIEENFDVVLDYTKGIIEKYFISPTPELESLVKAEILEKFSNCEIDVHRQEIYLEHFDEVILACYNFLYSHYIDYKKTEQFAELYNKVYINTCIQDALINVGLLNKY